MTIDENTDVLTDEFLDSGEAPSEDASSIDIDAITGEADDAPSAEASAAPDDWLRSGARAAEQLEAEKKNIELAREERERQRKVPFRYRLPEHSDGQMIVLDEQIGAAMYEHTVRSPTDPSKWVNEPCPKEWETCPLCEKGERASYVSFLTVLDLRPFTTKPREGKPSRTVKWSRKLLAIKPGSMGPFQRKLKEFGSLRGCRFLMTREGRTTAAIGQPEFQSKHTEEKLLEVFSHDQVLNDKGEVVKAANEDCFPVNYRECFSKPSAADLRRKFGGTPPPGSDADNSGWD